MMNAIPLSPANNAKTSTRAVRTRHALVQAGLDLFARKPVDAVSVDEIVAAAGVAKGSFFNHFADKHAFARHLAAEIRLEIERDIDAANRDEADPVLRLARGMRIAASYALANRERALVLLRAHGGATNANHPLNAGVSSDISAVVEVGKARPEAARWGVLYWVGLCQALMIDLVQRDKVGASDALSAMMIMGLTGIGAGLDEAHLVAAAETAAFQAHG